MLLKAPLLLGLITLVSHVCSSDFVDISRRANHFALCVEFAVFHFNQVYPDEYAYKLLWVRRSQRKVDCTFVVDIRPWLSQFSLLNSTCVQK